MIRLEDLKQNASVRGILPDCLVTVVNAQWFGSEAIELTYKEPAGKVGNELLYRHDEVRIEIVEEGRPWSLDGDAALFRLVSEAQPIRLGDAVDDLSNAGSEGRGAIFANPKVVEFILDLVGCSTPAVLASPRSASRMGTLAGTLELTSLKTFVATLADHAGHIAAETARATT